MPNSSLKKRLMLSKQRELSLQEKNEIIKKHIKSITITPQMGNDALNEALRRQVTDITIKYIPENIGVIQC